MNNAVPISGRRRGRRRFGFTLIEVLVTVIVLGIAAAMVVPTMLDTGTLSIQGAARRVVADILMAQNEAIAQRREMRLVFDPAGDRYGLFDANGQPVGMAWQKDGYRVDFSQKQSFDGVRMRSADFAGGTVLSFDELGTPSNGGTIEIVSGETAYRIRVTPFTGRVTVEPIE